MLERLFNAPDTFISLVNFFFTRNKIILVNNSIVYMNINKLQCIYDEFSNIFL